VNDFRKQKILSILEQKGEIQLQKLKEFFPDVSTMTLRRDLIALEKEGHLIRTHGGAISTKKLWQLTGQEDEYSKRAQENIEAKMKIANIAKGLVEKNRSIYFDAGSTIMCLAKIIDDSNFTIITSGLNIALELAKKKNVFVVMLGGIVNSNTLSVSGPNAIFSLDRMNIDIAFMSASGFCLETGFSVSNAYEGELKKRIIEQSQKVVMLMDTSKVRRNMPFSYARLDEIDIWVCEKALPEDIEKAACDCGVKILY